VPFQELFFQLLPFLMKLAFLFSLVISFVVRREFSVFTVEPCYPGMITFFSPFFLRISQGPIFFSLRLPSVRPLVALEVSFFPGAERA